MRAKKLASLKKGTKLKIKPSATKWYLKNSWESCTVAGVINKESDAQHYLCNQLLARGFPRKVTLIEFLSCCGDGPGARVKVNFGKSLVKTFIFSHKELSLA